MPETDVSEVEEFVPRTEAEKILWSILEHKDRTISAMGETIEAQARTIHLLQDEVLNLRTGRDV